MNDQGHSLQTKYPTAPPDLELVAKILDGLGIAMCVFDFSDRTLLWNDTFLQFFPEHSRHIYKSEPYQQNLKRFYHNRLSPEEMTHIGDYIERGVLRHRSQTRPFTFEHRGRWIKVAVQTVPELGRIRTWTQVDAPRERLRQDQPDGIIIPAPTNTSPLDDLPDAVAILDLENRVVSFNEEFRILYGLSAQTQIQGLTFEDVVRLAWRQRASDDDYFRTQILPSLREEQRFSGAPFEVPLPQDRWVRVIEQRNIQGLRSSVHFDVSLFKREHKKLQEAEIQARASEARFRAVIERSPVGMSISTPEGALVEVNAAYAGTFGYVPSELAGKLLWDILDPTEVPQAKTDLEALLRGEAPAITNETRILHKDGTSRWVTHSAVILRSQDGGSDLVISQIQDISSHKQAEAERDALLEALSHRATHDGLTGLPNRARFEEELFEAAAEIRATGRTHAVCLVDLDRFKIVNDTAGHGAGDAVLKHIGAALRSAVRSSDFIARIGGDEFGLLLRDCTIEQAEGIAKGVVDKIGNIHLDWQGNLFSVGASIGIAQFTGDNSIQEVITLADQACYTAKRAGRNCVITLD